MNSIDLIEDISDLIGDSSPQEKGLVEIRSLNRAEVLKLSELHESLFGRSELNESLIDIRGVVEGEKPEGSNIEIVSRSVRNLEKSPLHLKMTFSPSGISNKPDEVVDPALLNVYNKLLTQGSRLEFNEHTQKEDLHQEFLDKLSDVAYVEGKYVVDILRHGTSEYTNIVNLNPYLSNFFGRSLVQMGVKFVMSGLIYSKEINFSPVELIDDLDFQTYDFQQDLFQGKVTVECIDRVIRVFGNVPEITECIIDHLYFHYGDI